MNSISTLAPSARGAATGSARNSFTSKGGGSLVLAEALWRQCEELGGDPAAGGCVMVVASSRPPLVERGRADVVVLGPLRAADAFDLLRGFLGGLEAPRKLLRAAVRAAGGFPLRLRQIARVLIKAWGADGSIPPDAELPALETELPSGAAAAGRGKEEGKVLEAGFLGRKGPATPFELESLARHLLRSGSARRRHAVARKATRRLRATGLFGRAAALLEEFLSRERIPGRRLELVEEISALLEETGDHEKAASLLQTLLRPSARS